MTLCRKYALLTTLLVGLTTLSLSNADASLSTPIIHDYGSAITDYVPNPGVFDSVGDTGDTRYGVVTDEKDKYFSDAFVFSQTDTYVTSIDLELRFDSTGNGGENWWTLDSNSATENFKLMQTSVNDWTKQNFTFDKSSILLLCPDFFKNGIFTLRFFEKTGGTNVDKFRLDYAKVTFNTAPVPVPGAAMLLGSGLLGIVAIRRRRTV